MTSTRHISRMALVFVAVVCGSLPAAYAQNKPKDVPPQREMGSRKNYVGLPNFGEVTPHLFRGGQPGVDGLEQLKKMGVSIVVDMRGNASSHEKAVVEKLGLQYVSIPWHCPFPKNEAFARFLQLMQENKSKKVFVHCRLGDDRTGMAIAAYRMALEGWSADEAMQEMKLFGFSGVHHAICPGLASYEKGFPKLLESDPAFEDFRSREISEKTK